MTEIPETFPDTEMPTIIIGKGVDHPKMYTEMTYLVNNNIDEDIYQKPRKEYVYETNMKNIYNLIVGQANKKLQEKAAPDTTLQESK